MHTQNQLMDKIKHESDRCSFLRNEVSKVVVGQETIIDFIIMGLLCNGHILLEGVPGVAKTTMIKSLTQALGFTFKRIQFTPDLLPSDLIGTLIYNQKTHEFETKKGPIFANLILADEINRAPSKVQSALLEAMQEQQVTIGSETFLLDNPFIVFATQNPIEQEGTYRLPEAQIDRFMFKLHVEYPSIAHEKDIIKRTQNHETIMQVMHAEDIFNLQKIVHDIYVDDRIVDYLVSIIDATRRPEKHALPQLKSLLAYGVSPRASISLYKAAKAHAFLKNRYFVTPDDIKAVAFATLRHRISLTYEAEAQAITPDEIISTILNTIPTP